MKPVSFKSIFRYTTLADRLSIVVAIISATIAGCGFPLCNILAGKISAVLSDVSGYWYCDRLSKRPLFSNGSSTNLHANKEFHDSLSSFSLYLALIGVMQLIFAYLAIWLFNRVAENQVTAYHSNTTNVQPDGQFVQKAWILFWSQAYRLRLQYVQGLLRQDIGWYDLNSDTSFISRIVEDVRKIHEAIGPKLGLFIYYLNNSILCLIISFWYGWLLTLIALSVLPLSALSLIVLEKLQSRLSVKLQEQRSQSGNVIQQALRNIKTVMAFGGQEKEIQKFEQKLSEAQSTQVKRGVVAALGLGLSWFFKYCGYAITIWYGTKLVYDDIDTACKKDRRTYDIAVILIVLFSILDLEFNFSQCSTFLESFAAGRGAATAIFEVIDRVPEIDSSCSDGIRSNSPLAGRVEFRNVKFSYPCRPDVMVLDGINLVIEPGTTLALVGRSGCGKSTFLQLLQRFYDPVDGAILVDGKDIRDYNLKWYRSQMSVVNQEPALFNVTIERNLRYGNPRASQEDLEIACSLANAQEFISRLPNKYDTIVGHRGAQLSGGQKQRICLARVLVQNPSILILDEVTSALDVRTEAIVQNAISDFKKGRTTIIVAHRVSTIINADVIALIEDGRVVAQGSPNEIQRRSSLYISRILADAAETCLHDSCLKDEAICEIPSEDRQNISTASVSTTETEYDAQVKSFASLNTLFKLASLNKKDWPAVVIGLLTSIAHGLVLPVTGYYFGRCLEVFSKKSRQTGENLANEYAFIFLCIGVTSFWTQFLSLATFGCAGGSLTTRLRKLVFVTMMRQELAWFQLPENNVGALCTRLSRDVASVQEATGTHLGIFVGAMTTIVISVALCFFLNVKLALVGWAFSPLILAAAYFNGRMVETQESQETGVHEKASNIVFEAVTNIRTVATLGLEETFAEQFTWELEPTYRLAKRRTHVLGIVFGTSQAAIHFAYAAVLYYGGTLVEKGESDYSQVFTIGEALVWTILEMGLTLAYLPNYTKAKVSAARIFTLVKRKSEFSESGMDINTCNGSIRFEDVNFSYTTRRNMSALKHISWEAESNSRVGICGASGSGKSTILEMILRFYDPTTGRIYLDGEDYRSFSPYSLRAQMGLVSQEPALFDSTLADNIAYGLNAEEFDMERVVEAARMASIHDFIVSLPEGYSTRVGEMGVQLSGGQKQRVAIARALARSPRILLLDEATSALDAVSEKSVEEALEIGASGRTCIKVAHRLETLKDSDKILVVSHGSLAEVGTHEELLKLKGIYSNMWSMQSDQLNQLK